MHCKYLKLSNGDNLIVTTDDTCQSFEGKEFIEVIDPVKLIPIKFTRGKYVVESFVMEPWVRIAEDDVFSIPVKNIIVAANLKEGAIEYYQRFLSVEDGREVSLTSDEVNAVIEKDETDDGFDEYMDEILGMDDQEDEYDGNTTNSRTIH